MKKLVFLVLFLPLFCFSQDALSNVDWEIVKEKGGKQLLEAKVLKDDYVIGLRRLVVGKKCRTKIVSVCNPKIGLTLVPDNEDPSIYRWLSCGTTDTLSGWCQIVEYNSKDTVVLKSMIGSNPEGAPRNVMYSDSQEGFLRKHQGNFLNLAKYCRLD